jgi:hypothetical protein
MLNRIDDHHILAAGTAIAGAWRAARQVPPLWPLDSSVTVNPFLGQADGPLELAAARLGRVAGMRITMPRSWYAARIRSGEIEDRARDDLCPPGRHAPIAQFLLQVRQRTSSHDGRREVGEGAEGPRVP